MHCGNNIAFFVTARCGLGNHCLLSTLKESSRTGKVLGLLEKGGIEYKGFNLVQACIQIQLGR